jgi:hypothetical protein
MAPGERRGEDRMTISTTTRAEMTSEQTTTMTSEIIELTSSLLDLLHDAMAMNPVLDDPFATHYNEALNHLKVLTSTFRDALITE